ncbi:MAG: hypothetical protein C4584_00440 [Armatimonadetes bacterium]|nr:MAG: hypothetical protein C4584_00440 [Armatimonadota bacterium]
MAERLLLLTSNGIKSEEMRQATVDFFNGDHCGQRLLFVDTAAEPLSATDYVEESKRALISLGFRLEENVDIKRLSTESLRMVLKKCNGVFVEGGDPYYLLYWLRTSHFKRIVADRMDENPFAYIGSSSGSVVACKDASVIKWHHLKSRFTNTIGLTDFSGLQLALVDSIYPHAHEGTKKLIKKQAKPSRKIVPIKDNQALAVTGEKIELVGQVEQTQPKQQKSSEIMLSRLTDSNRPLIARARDALTLLQSTHPDLRDSSQLLILQWAVRVLKKPENYGDTDRRNAQIQGLKILNSISQQYSA